MSRARELADELVEEAPQGAANALGAITWIIAAILAGLIILFVAIVLVIAL